MTEKITGRGFRLENFKDANGVECSLQKSSAAERDLIWLGCDNIGIKTFVRYTGGWKDVPDDKLPEIFNCQDVLANTRMHLSRESVADLLPHLQRFVETGEL